MKKIITILGTLLLLIVGLLVAVYGIRKNNSKNQFVSELSTSILSISVDDLILDNLLDFISFQPSTSVDSLDTVSWENKFIWNAGILIPAQMFLFTLPEKEEQLYGIAQIKNFDKCFSYFVNYFPDGINFMGKDKETVSVSINKHLKIIFNKSFLIYEWSLKNTEDFSNLEYILQNRATWTTISILKDIEPSLFKKHINYVQRDQKLTMNATIKNGKATLNGEWKLSASLKNELEIIRLDTINQTLRFWNLLPLDESSSLTVLLTKITGLNRGALKSHYKDYMDLQVKNELTTQTESHISYTYDEEFNEIEEVNLMEQQVPKIIATWNYDLMFESSLPKTMFYKFTHQKSLPYLISSTQNLATSKIESIETPYPLYFSVDFEQWPKVWETSFTSYLSEKKVKAKLYTIPQEGNKLLISGEISY